MNSPLLLSGIRRVMAGLRHDFFDQIGVYVMKAFIDDSGSGGDSPWYVLAGYVGTVDAWDSFETPWRKILDGPPKLAYFKASEAESLRDDGPWEGVSKEERDSRLNAFIEVIGQLATRAFNVRLKQKDYDEVIKPYVPPRWDNAYFFLFMGFLTATTSIEKYLGDGQPVEFIFDASSKKRIEKPSLRLYDQCIDLPELAGRIHNIHYEDEKLFLPLQAADLLAWQIRRRFSIEGENRPQFEMALNAPKEKPFEHVIARDDLEMYGMAMDLDAKSRWAEMGCPEELRPFKRSQK